jgi:signal transduction histidine kinase
MSPFGSLTNRMFLATAFLAVLSIGAAVYIVNKGVTRQAEGELERGLQESGTLVDEYRTVLFDHFRREARLIADLPVLKAAAFETSVETLRPIAQAYQEQINADVFVITDRRGSVLVHFAPAGVPSEALARLPTVPAALHGRETVAFWPVPHGIIQLVSVPISVGQTAAEVLGTLSLGVALDDRQAAKFKSLTASDLAFGVNGAIQSSTLPADLWPKLAPLLDRPGVTSRIQLGTDEYIVMTRPLLPDSGPDQPRVIVLRSVTERLRFLGTLHTLLGVTAVLAVLGAILLSYWIARTVTRPLGTITATMREMAATGDLTRRIPIAPDPRWQDEDARVLATTFNLMTDSIQRFQREATQRERLSSLGRLSTVVAHEIRNPLMIIKASLRTLRRDDVRPAQVQAAAGDIDEEINRLNRIVTEVLDFARPIKFDLAPADLNALASDAARAAGAHDARHPIRLGLDPDVPEITTDAERLRQVLVNVLSNAAQAMDARAGDAPADAPIRLETHRLDGSRVVVTVRDRGVGIAPDHLAKIFDPYFTTRRTGTGIGLAISRNIIEGLGGRISVASQPDRGTEVRIELPLHATP